MSNVKTWHLNPTEAKKANVWWFIYNFAGEEDPWLQDMVRLSQAVLKEVH